MYQGIDTSSNNQNGTGIVDFPAVSRSGRTFAMIRVGYGIQRTWGFEGYVSKSFVPQLVQAQAAGLDTGVYWYSHALNTDQARIEARTCLDAIKPYRLTFPVSFDQEYEPQILALSRRERTNICIAFLQEIRKAGYYPMMYASKDWFETKVYDKELAEYDHWVAQYASKLTYSGEAGIWQYSGSGTIPGVTGLIDLDVAYRDYPKLIREGGYNHLEPPADDHDYKALYEAEREKNQKLIEQLKQLIETYGED